MKSIFISAIVAALVAAAMHFMLPLDFSGQTAAKETAYERVMRTKTLRCGWFAEPPFTNFDPNTGEKNGIVVDIVNRFASDYDVKIEWVTISNFALMGEDLKEGKYDAICASLFSLGRGGMVDTVDPFVFMPAYGYVRSDETRLTSLAQLDNPDFRIAGQEGAAVTAVAREKFPQSPISYYSLGRTLRNAGQRRS